MAQDVFKRVEKKYMLSHDQYEMLGQRLQAHMSMDRFGRHTICNVFFDTQDFYLTRTSVEKPVYKEKLRLRSYGVPTEGDDVFIELKKKYKGVVYKRRVALPLKEARAYLYQGVKPQKKSQILSEIDYFLQMNELQPMVYLCYDRIALFGNEDNALRVTFDTNIRWRESSLDLALGAWGQPLLGDGQVLMEIKIHGAMPLWLSNLLDELQVYPASFSKVGTVYTQHLMGMLDLGGDKKCYQVS